MKKRSPPGVNGETQTVCSPVRGNFPADVFEELRNLIVLGRLAPGTWIVEADLAKRLKFSRTPIRSALQWLAREGYVVAHSTGKKSRMQVSPLTKEDAKEIFYIVGHIESLASLQTAALPAENRAQISRKLAKINSALHEIAECHRAEPDRILELDTSFHDLIVSANSGPRLIALHGSIKPQTRRYFRLYASSIIKDLHYSVSEHEEIIKTISSGDAKGAERAMQANWQNGAERLATIIELFGEHGTW
jgi:DNA-binding GntR family transcriptional regulator